MDAFIRNFNENDTSSVVAIHNLCKGKFEFEKITPDFIFEILQKPGFEFAVAVVDDKVAGFAGALFDEQMHLSELGPIAVHPEYRNRGIGTEFIVYLFKFLKSKKIRIVNARVKSDNKEAVKFLEKFGFEVVLEPGDYKGKPGITMLLKVL